MFGFRTSGVANTAIVDQNPQLRPGMTTLVVMGENLFCVSKFLYCLDPSDDLPELWRISDKALIDQA